MKLFFGVFFLLAVGKSTEGSSCCTGLSIQNFLCNRACRELESQQGQGHAKEIQTLTKLIQNCPKSKTSLWRCVNATYTALQEVEQFYGRPCCNLAFMDDCQQTCMQSRSTADLTPSCRRSDELHFYNCLERQQAGDRCCAYATIHECKVACRSVFIGDSTPTRAMKQLVEDYCKNDNPRVITCVKNSTKATQVNKPEESLSCCNRAPTQHCRDVCKNALVSLPTEQEIVEKLITECGSMPNPMDPMWQCFLSNSPKVVPSSPIDKTGIDAAKLHCCVHASSNTCRDLCLKTFMRGGSDQKAFYSAECYYNMNTEKKMFMCLTEVDEPCTMGCSGMSYCQNFNRPTELFRSCNARADSVAKEFMRNLVANNAIQSPMATIPLKDIDQCQPETWKAIACALELKPCHSRKITENLHMICKSSCVKLLQQCLDTSRLHPDSPQTPEKICSVLLEADNTTECIALEKFLDIPTPQALSEVTHPCQPNPCNESQVCEVNRRKCKHPENCKPFVCKPACRLGDVSQFLVPRYSYVRVPNHRQSGESCHKVCKCSHRGVLDACLAATCTTWNSCLIGRGQIQEHKSIFMDGCNKCVCLDSEKICTRKACQGTTTRPQTQFTGLPCDCAEEYNPVCAPDGKTYPSRCLAWCAGHHDSKLLPGSCASQDPCKDNPCADDKVCVRRKKECLNTGSQDCKQYVCVPVTCNRHYHDPVCDTVDDEHNNMCLLLYQQRELAHWGHCNAYCHRTGPVCAHNGDSYANECAAWGDRVTVDYPGMCQGVGKLPKPECTTVTCEPLIKNCQGIIPPGACCPICASEIRILYSKTQAERATSSADIGPVSVQDIANKLRLHVGVAECDVFGYLSIEGDIVIVVKAITKEPTQLQVKACNTEAEKISTLIQSGSPRIMSDLTLSTLITSEVRTAEFKVVSQAANHIPSLYSLLLTGLVTILLSWQQR